MSIENSLGEAATIAGGGGVVFLFIRKMIKDWFSDRRDAVKDNAEANLYQNLIAENTRLAESVKKLSLQIDVLIEDNITLQAKVAKLERQLTASHDWELTAKELQEELDKRDLLIAKFARREDTIGKDEHV